MSMEVTNKREKEKLFKGCGEVFSANLNRYQELPFLGTSDTLMIFENTTTKVPILSMTLKS